MAGSVVVLPLGGATLRWAAHWNEVGEPTHLAGSVARYEPLTASKLPTASGQGIWASPGGKMTTSPKPLAPRFSCTMKSGEEFWWAPIAQRT